MFGSMPDALIAQAFTGFPTIRGRFLQAAACPTVAPSLPTSDRVSLQQLRCAMWNWIRCYVTGHDYCVSCERGSMFLKCIVCERRSQGWEVSAKASHTHSA
jgi:hypothetical protein